MDQEGAKEPRRVFTFDQMDEVAELVIGHMDGGTALTADGGVYRCLEWNR